MLALSSFLTTLSFYVYLYSCGGDLAYPNPSTESYEDRLILPFEYALPPPPWSDTPGCALEKPQLPPSCPSLAAYPGPIALIMPGNHDWFDGLETFTRYIIGKHWLGGWLLPQKSSYFALQLPHGWWIWGVDLALSGDIDAAQFQYFADVARNRMGPQDRAIVCTHEPTWLLAWHAGTSEPAVLLDLLSTHLHGRCTIRYVSFTSSIFTSVSVISKSYDFPPFPIM